jgi:hypothetical protein
MTAAAHGVESSARAHGGSRPLVGYRGQRSLWLVPAIIVGAMAYFLPGDSTGQRFRRSVPHWAANTLTSLFERDVSHSR